jgi:Nif-specific regulatory protein
MSSRDDAPLPEIVGASPAMREVYRLTRLAAPTRARVLILGETGTGKELIARAIHERSARADGPYVRVNCGALSESLLESELYGHVKGAFTGAVDNKIGRFEAAHTGTLFLDEIPSMSFRLQVKLLRVLQEGEFERVGDSRTIRVDVRVIAATNLSLEEEIAAGRFRDDLFYRLNVIPIYLPPLRERRDDIPDLARFFLKRYAAENGRDVPEFSDAMLKAFQQYDWPGNVRELENHIERLIVLSEGRPLSPDLAGPPGEEVHGLRAKLPRTSDDVPTLVRQLVRQSLLAVRAGEPLYDRVMTTVERELIEQVMRQCGQVQVKAAARLQMNRNTLHQKIKEFTDGDRPAGAAG